MRDISIEISILSPLPARRLRRDYSRTHGLILEEKGTGTFAAAGSVEHKLNRDRTLMQFARNRFPPGYWRSKQLKLSAFTATVFNEQE